jgi:hypothetical protein
MKFGRYNLSAEDNTYSTLFIFVLSDKKKEFMGNVENEMEFKASMTVKTHYVFILI